MQRKASDPPGEHNHLLISIDEKSEFLFAGLTLSHDGHPRSAELLAQRLQTAASNHALLAAIDTRHCNTLFVASYVGRAKQNGLASSGQARPKANNKQRKQAANAKSAPLDIQKHIDALKMTIQDASGTLPGCPVFFVCDGRQLWEELSARKSWNWMTPRDLSSSATISVTEQSLSPLSMIPQSFLAAALENTARHFLCAGLSYSLNLQNQCSRPGVAWHLRQLQAASIEVTPSLHTEQGSLSFACRVFTCVRRLVPPARDQVKTILNKRRKEARTAGLYDNEAFTAAKDAGKLFKSQRTMGKCQVLDMKLMCDSDTVVELLPSLEPVRLVRLFWGAFPEPSALQLESQRRGFALYDPMTEDEFWRSEALLGSPQPPTSGDSLVAEVQLLSGFGGTILVSTARLTHACPVLRCASRLQAPEMLKAAVACLDGGFAGSFSHIAHDGKPVMQPCSDAMGAAGIEVQPLPTLIQLQDMGAAQSGPYVSDSECSLDFLSQDSGASLLCAESALKSAGNVFISAKRALPASCELTSIGGTKPSFRCFAASDAKQPAGQRPQLLKQRSMQQLASIPKRAFSGSGSK